FALDEPHLRKLPGQARDIFRAMAIDNQDLELRRATLRQNRSEAFINERRANNRSYHYRDLGRSRRQGIHTPDEGFRTALCHDAALGPGESLPSTQPSVQRGRDPA